MDEQRRAFADAVRKLLATAPPAEIARDFSARLAAAWPRKAVGFALGGDGKLLAPSAQGRGAIRMADISREQRRLSFRQCAGPSLLGGR